MSYYANNQLYNSYTEASFPEDKITKEALDDKDFLFKDKNDVWERNDSRNMTNSYILNNNESPNTTIKNKGWKNSNSNINDRQNAQTNNNNKLDDTTDFLSGGLKNKSEVVSFIKGSKHTTDTKNSNVIT